MTERPPVFLVYLYNLNRFLEGRYLQVKRDLGYRVLSNQLVDSEHIFSSFSVRVLLAVEALDISHRQLLLCAHVFNYEHIGDLG